jgi:membrane-associated phospholipid phosphatase
MASALLRGDPGDARVLTSTIFVLAAALTRPPAVITMPVTVPVLAQVSTNPQNPKSPANPRRPLWQLAADVGSDFKHLPSVDTAEWLAVGGGLALLAHPYDDNINNHLVGRPWVHTVFQPGKVIGYGATQFGAAAATMFWGRHFKEPKVVHLGTDLLRAQIMTQLITLGIKESVRRQRPDKSGGFSFPSGHASVTFASATVLERHLGWRAFPAYLVASYVAASRLHENRHFASDVIFGAAVGAVCGRTTTRHGRDKWTLMPVARPGTVAIVVARR